MSKTRVTLKDVANKVGVHSSTVSRVLNPETRKMVTEEIAAKILSAATEMGYRPPVVTERQQAQFMVRAYMYAWSEGIRLLTWHMLWDYTPKGDPGMAILRHDHTPRPAYAAYATMTRLLERAKFTGPVEGLSATQRGFRFEKRGKLIRVLWDTKAGSNLILNHDQPVEIINLVGGSSTVKPADGMLKVPLSLDPIYVLSEK